MSRRDSRRLPPPGAVAVCWRWLFARAPARLRAAAWVVRVGPRGRGAFWARWAWPVLRPLPLLLLALAVFGVGFGFGWLFPGPAAVLLVLAWFGPLFLL